MASTTRWLSLDAGLEVSVRTDKLSIEYRRWWRDLATNARREPAAFARLGLGTAAPAGATP